MSVMNAVDICKPSLLVTQGLDRKDVMESPFPMLIARDALDASVFKQLLDGLPPLKTMLKGTEYGSNQRINYSASSVALNPSVPQIWKDFVQAHVNQEFLDDLIRLFGPSILNYYPDFEGRFGSLNSLRSGIREIDKNSPANVFLDCQIAVNTPASLSGTTVRGPHVDCPKKLFVGLLYMRLDEDKSDGGDLEIYRPKRRPVELDYTRTADLDDMEFVTRVPYEKNVLVMFLNTPESLHGVSPRSQTDVHRVFVNLVAEMPTQLFQLQTGAPATTSGIVNTVAQCSPMETADRCESIKPGQDGSLTRRPWIYPAL